MRFPRLAVDVVATTFAVAGLIYVLRVHLGTTWETAVSSALVTYSLLLVAAYARHRRLREETSPDVDEEIQKNPGAHIPLNLHPVVDHQRCIGSLSCLQVCPEGDILGVVNGKAALINPIGCIGHGKCELECPVDAIKLVFGSSQRGVDLPHVDEFFESARPGIHIIGELGGMGLIRNAMVQGVQLAQHLGKEPSGGKGNVVDVAIVGAGPAGLAAALGLKEKGLSFRVLDQQSLGGAIFSYPRQKVVVSEPVKLPLHGWFGKGTLIKEQLLEEMSKMARKAGFTIEEGTKVTGIEGEDGDFRVLTNKGEVRARKVVLAIGRRGTPRKLGCPGDELPKVTYLLTDPQQYDGARMLVVGGGDSALEAAMQLANETDAEVTLMHRNPDFGRARAINKTRIQEHVAAGRVRLLMNATVERVTEEEVHVLVEGRPVTLRNDFVVACLGGELPTAFLTSLGITLKRHFGTGLGEESDGGDGAKAKQARAKRGSAKKEAELAKRHRLSVMLFAIGVVLTGCFTVAGWDYYRLSDADRMHSPYHEMLRPAGPWGHGIGIVATMFMMSNFIYALRKRWSALKGSGHINSWLTWHQFVGFMSPVMICFHAAFQSNNVLATFTAAGMTVVVLTGIIGRYVYGFVSDDNGQVRKFSETLAHLDRYKHRSENLLRSATGVTRLEDMLAADLWRIPRTGSLFVTLLRFPFELLRGYGQLQRARRLFKDREDYVAFRASGLQLLKLRVFATFHVRLKLLLRVWRVWHVALALVLVVLITAHIGVSVYLGFTWIF